MRPRKILFLGLTLALTACSSSSKVADTAADGGPSRSIAANDDKYVIFVDDGNKTEYRAIVFKRYSSGGGEIATCDKNTFINGVLAHGQDRDSLYQKCKVEEKFENETEYNAFVSKMKDYLIANPKFGFEVFLLQTASIGASIYNTRWAVPAIGEIIQGFVEKKIGNSSIKVLRSSQLVPASTLYKEVRWADYFGRVFSDKRFYKTAEDAARAEKILLKGFKIRSGATAIFTGLTLTAIILQTDQMGDESDANDSHKSVKTVITSFNEAQTVAGADPIPISFTGFFRAMRSKELGYPTWGDLKKAAD